MKYSNIPILSVLLPCLFFFVSCRDDMLGHGAGMSIEVEEGIPGILTLSVGSDEPVSHVVTRATEKEEKNISSLYVFVIDVTGEGNPANCRILSKKWFPDTQNLSRDASGKLQVSIPAVSCNSVRIFAVANLNTANQLANNEDMLNRFHNVTTEAELEDVTAELDLMRNTENALVDRVQGSLLSSGHFYCVHQNTSSAGENQYPLYTDGVKLALEEDAGRLILKHKEGGSNAKGESWAAGEVVNGSIWLHHLDAKVTFHVKLAKDMPEGAYFKLKSWKVKNLRKRSFVHWQANDPVGSGDELAGTSDLKGDYIVEEASAENNDIVSSFSFYALESRKGTSTIPFPDIEAVKNAMGISDFTNADQAFALREKKKGDGSFLYAPSDAAYVVLKGEYYNPKEKLEDEGGLIQQRAANVTYLIHLGYIGRENMEDISSASGSDALNKLNDFRILRNSSYVYNVTVSGADNIRVEAMNGLENQPAAEGTVVDSEFDLQADAHYEQRLIVLNLQTVAEHIETTKAQYLYTVNTPFTGGAVEVKLFDDGNDNRSSTLDDGWVHFAYLGNGSPGAMTEVMLGRIAEGAGYGLPYTYTYDVNPEESSARNPVQLWGPLTLLKNLQLWVKTYNDAIEAGKSINTTNSENPYIELDGGLKFYLNRYFTVYVDEYYYTQNPVTGTTSNTLWTRFCNTDDRTMSIFQENYSSSDTHSSFSRSGLNIRQRSIQTIYSPLQSGQQLAMKAYGIEHTDEYGGNYNVDKEKKHPFTQNDLKGDIDGLDNTLRGLWVNSVASSVIGSDFAWKGASLLFPYDDRTSNGGKGEKNKWSSRYITVAALSRNRDNNRNGIIDKEEILWYVPARFQLMNLYMGTFLMDDPLYQSKLLKKTKQCYVTSTGTNTKWQCFLMADEGPSVKWLKQDNTLLTQEFLHGSYTRCARNLGIPPVLRNTPPYTGSVSDYAHEDMTITSPKPDAANVNYTITFNKYNTAGMRSYIGVGGLGSHTLFQAAARPSHGFVTAKSLLATDGVTWEEASRLCRTYSEREDRSDKETWRLPNASEALAMLLNLTPSSIWLSSSDLKMWTCTLSLHSTSVNPEYFCVDYDEKNMFSVSFREKGYVRCVRDTNN